MLRGCASTALASSASPRSDGFDAVATDAEDVAIIAFTSGTTGVPKGCVHLHRDLLAICDTFGAQVLRPRRGRRVHRDAAARVHLRPRRERAVPDARRRLHRADRAAVAGRGGRRHRAPLDHDALDRPDDVPGDAARRRPGARPLAPRVRVGGRAAAGGRRHGVDGAHRRAHHRRHRLHGDAPHLHRLPRRGGAPGVGRPAGAGLRGGGDGRGDAARRAGRGRPPRGARPDRLPLPRRISPFIFSALADGSVATVSLPSSVVAAIQQARNLGKPVVPTITDGAGKGGMAAILADPGGARRPRGQPGRHRARRRLRRHRPRLRAVRLHRRAGLVAGDDAQLGAVRRRPERRAARPGPPAVRHHPAGVERHRAGAGQHVGRTTGSTPRTRSSRSSTSCA